MRLNHADPLVAFLIRSLERAQYCRTISTELGNVVEGVLEDLIQVLSDLGETEVSYEEAPDLTGVPLKTLQNRRIENVGNRRAGAYRLKDLPFREGAATPARLVAAYDRLRQMRSTQEEEEAAARERAEAEKRRLLRELAKTRNKNSRRN